MSGSPRASVIIPSFDHAAFVEAAVASALDQTERDVEVLVIDDGSRDDSRERLARLSDPRLHVFFQENRGLSRTLNRGLALARAPWVKFLPSDDLLEPECIHGQLGAAASDPSLGVIFSLPRIVDAAGVALADPSPQAWFDTELRDGPELRIGLLERNFLCAPGALFSRALALELGGFDPSLVVAQDYDLWLRMLSRTSGRLIPQRMVRVRWHGRNQSAQATAATEAERAYALVLALHRSGLAQWLDWYREARGGDAAGARLGLAATLLRSGLSEVLPFARKLVGEARALGATPPLDRALDPLLLAAPELTRPGEWGDPAELAASRPPGPPRELRAAPVALRAPSGRRPSGLRRLVRAARRVISRARDRRRASAPLPAAAGAPPEPGPRPTHWVVLAAGSFDDFRAGRRSAELACALGRRGERVSYATRFRRGDGTDAEVVEPAVRVAPWDVAEIRRLLGARDERLRVLVELPEGQVVGLAREASSLGARVLYDKLAAWERCTFAPWYSRADEDAMVACADDLIGAGRPLVRSLAASGRPVHYLPNAVDRAVFHACAADLEPPIDAVRGEVTLVYPGGVWGEWLDWELLVAVAETRPSWSLLLLGDRSVHPGRLPANLRLLGAKPARSLPAYLRVADACFLPLRRTPLTEALSPLELFESLALYRPVIAPRLGELADAPYVFFAEDAPQVLEAVARARATPPPGAELESFLARHTWDARAASLIALAERPSIAVIVLRRGGREVVRGCVDALLSGRGEQSYRLAVVDDGSDGGEDAELLALEEAGDILLLRSALRGAGASRNLGVRATHAEIVVFVDADQRVDGPGWLDAAVKTLAADRRIGAVGLGSGPDSGLVPHLEIGGLVVPRSVLARTRGFDERFDPAGCGGLDLSFQIRDAGYTLARSSTASIQGGPPRPLDDSRGRAVSPEARRRLRSKWRQRPGFLDSLPPEPTSS